MNRGSLSQLQENVAEIAAPPSADRLAASYFAAAYHEAGHAVGGYLRFGLRFIRVRIYPSDDGLDIIGAVTVAGAANGAIDGLKKAIICLCGPAAEARATNVSLRQILGSNIAAVDVEMALDALKRTVGEPPLDVAIRAARRVVELEANRIDRVAVQLRRRGELSYEECRRIASARR
jgi:hypothetical protein